MGVRIDTRPNGEVLSVEAGSQQEVTQAAEIAVREYAKLTENSRPSRVVFTCEGIDVMIGAQDTPQTVRRRWSEDWKSRMDTQREDARREREKGHPALIG